MGIDGNQIWRRLPIVCMWSPCTVFNIVLHFWNETCVQAGTAEVTCIRFVQGTMTNSWHAESFNSLGVDHYNMAYLIDFYCRFVFLVSFHAVNMTINSWHAQCLKRCWWWLGCFIQASWWPWSVDTASVYCGEIKYRVPCFCLYVASY